MKTARLEGLVQVLILIGIAGMAGAASFTHVHDWTMRNAPAGTGSWFGWANAVISELTPSAAGIEIRRRKRKHPDAPIGYPMAILIAAAVLSLSAQVAEARPTIGGWISSAVPALAFLALTKLVLSRPHAPQGDTACATNSPENATGPNPDGPAPTTSTGTRPPAGSRSRSATPAPSATSSPAPALTPETLTGLRPVPTGQLLTAARMTAFAHQRETGQPITPGQLASRLSIPLALAESVLDHLGGTTAPPVTKANGTVINGSRP